MYSKDRQQVATAAAVVQENLHLLPASGTGLELACGLAANSFALAGQGLNMDAWDISAVAVEQVNQRAAADAANVTATARDVVEQPPEQGHYDLVVVSHFLDRSIIASIIDCLKSGGLVFYQTFSQTRVGEGGPSNMDFRLADNELLSLFAGLKVLVYREEGLQGDTRKGFRNEAMLVAQKPL
ncbi:MAG TPA: methyltransferase domain-containing protein [Candidatus Tenderia electrophaga]|uniref:Methyltransferase domain-containing protein n=1 Tax=Candidatus Tenderia electrophaga TaxID=1748243 RepID=A0A832N5R5_9GAMM|nr:methyltransferase domain-containing protein [Candidatus Tenderia electrophaga]